LLPPDEPFDAPPPPDELFEAPPPEEPFEPPPPPRPEDFLAAPDFAAELFPEPDLPFEPPVVLALSAAAATAP
jgi:hypothetical protein